MVKSVVNPTVSLQIDCETDETKSGKCKRSNSTVRLVVPTPIVTNPHGTSNG